MMHLFVGVWNEKNAIIVKISGARVHNTVVRDLYTLGYYGVHNNPSPARNFTYMNPAYILTPDLRTSLIILSHLLPGLHRSFLRLRFQDFMHFYNTKSEYFHRPVVKQINTAEKLGRFLVPVIQ
jgi:hypothetical protein